MRPFLIIFALVLGLFIYLIFRDQQNPFYIWAIQLGWSDTLNYIRAILVSEHIPAWFIYSFPDGLWMFAFVLFMMMVWDFRFEGIGKIWILSSVFLGITFEICQAFIKGMGAFDWMDMIFLSAGALLPILLFTKKNVYEKLC